MPANTLTLERPAEGAQTAGGPFISAGDGTRLFWREWGAGRPVLFVHSFAMASRMWDYQFAALGERGLRCIGFDRRGHGLSDVPAGGYDLDTFADDIASVIEALDLCGLTLVGHSMGCNEIVRYLSRHGEARIARVALLAPTTPFLRQTRDNPAGVPEAMFEAVRAGWAADFPKWVADNTAPAFVAETSPAMMQWVAEMMTHTPVTVAIACNRALTSADQRAEVKAIGVPTLVVHGDRDASAPLALTGARTAELIGGAQFRVYEGAPHGLMYTHMERLHADMLDFIGA